MCPITTLSAIELANRIRERQLTPVEVVEAHIARIEVTVALNTIVMPTWVGP